MIEIKNLKKVYDGKTVLNNINLKLENNMTAFIGPNGSGKTTTMKIIITLIKQYEGEVQIDYNTNSRLFGSLMENPKFYPSLTGRENLKYFSKLFQLSQEDNNMEELLSIFEMNEYINNKVNSYSLGMKQKLGICIALLGYPKYLILDEPTNGLDPIATKKIMEELNLLKKDKNINIFISSHMLSTLNTYADDIVMIKDGSIVSSGSIEVLSKEYLSNYKIHTKDKVYEANSNDLNEVLKKVTSNNEYITLIENLSNVMETIYFNGENKE